MSENHSGGNAIPEITREEHDGLQNAKRVSLVSASTIYVVANLIAGDTVGLDEGKNYIGLATVIVSYIPSLQFLPHSYYNQSSLVSGYIYHGFCVPGNNPTTSNFRLFRETINTGEVLVGGATTTFAHQWSSASLASISYL